MFDKKFKYTAVSGPDEGESADVEPMKRKFCTTACLWSSLFTGVLIGIYYIPSIGLTFYQRWLYQVRICISIMDSMLNILVFQSFQFPLITVIIHMTVKYILATLTRMALARHQKKQRVLVGWRDYIVNLAPAGVFSGLDISFSNWGLELVNISL